MSTTNTINFIFIFTCKAVPMVKIVQAHKHGQIQAVKTLKAEFGEDIAITEVWLEGAQPIPQKSMPPLFTNVNKESV